MSNDHHDRVRLIIDDCHRDGLDPVRALESAAALADERNDREQAEALRGEASRFLPLDFSGGAPEVRT